jgi:hypothetical protein
MGEGRRYTGNDGDVVGLEGLNGLLGSIATMYVRRDKLVPTFHLSTMVALILALTSLSRIWRSTLCPRLVRRHMMES